jgi:AcrR family transcriptional regulator
MSSLVDQPTPREPDPVVHKLPGGRQALSRELVVRSQRDRLLDAIAEVCASDAYGGASVAAVVARAGVSRKTFYEHFRNKEACFLAAHDAILNKFLGVVIDAYEQPELAWPKRVEAALEALLSFLAAEPAFARMCIVGRAHRQ